MCDRYVSVDICRYVEQFDQQTMVEMTRIVSAEGAALVEAQTSALFGDLKQLQRQMQVLTPVFCQSVHCSADRRCSFVQGWDYLPVACGIAACICFVSIKVRGL